MLSTAVIIVAAGRGARARTCDDAPPKQYRLLAGKPVLSHSLEIVEEHKEISTILVVIHPDDKQEYSATTKAYEQKIIPAVYGGATRQESVLAGLEALIPHKPNRVLIHDAARPLLMPDLIGRVIEPLQPGVGAVPVLPVTDTLRRGKQGYSEGTVSRENLWRVQTPQGFHFDDILQAHLSAKAAGEMDFTDDGFIAEWHGIAVRLVEGFERNRKLTTLEDFRIAEQLIMAEEIGATKVGPPAGTLCVGNGFDVHAFTGGTHVILCGIKIEHTAALSGHSDADVGLHSLTDALLGALGEGDIGTHFPPSDPRWAGADSSVFLTEAVNRVSLRGGRINHADVTLICEAPEIGPHREAMRIRLSELLAIPHTQVSVKATTTEGLGFTGRKEGIAALASATVWLP